MFVSNSRTGVQLGHHARMVCNSGKCQLGCLPSLIHCGHFLDLGIRYNLRTSGLFVPSPTLCILQLALLLQDRHDDARVGIRSTARLFGQHSRIIISLFSIAMIALLIYAGTKNDQGAPYYMGVTTAAGQLARVAWSVE